MFKPSFSDERTYTEAEVDTALAIFDAYQDVKWLEDFRANRGTAELRLKCMEMAREAETSWAELTDDERDVITWDFEFIPAWLEVYGTSSVMPVRIDDVRAELKRNYPDFEIEVRKVLEGRVSVTSVTQTEEN